MANLTARFQMIDDMSAKLDKIGQSGESMVDTLEEISDAADSAFGEVKSGSVQAARSVDGVASAATSAAQQTTEWGSEVANAAQQATAETERLGEETEEYCDYQAVQRHLLLPEESSPLSGQAFYHRYPPRPGYRPQ